MHTKAIAGIISGLLWAMLATAPALAQAKPDQKTSGDPALVARAQAIDQLVEQLRRSPARPSPAAGQMGINLIDAQGGEATLIAAEPDPRLDHCLAPAWSHDGKTIAFAAEGGARAFPISRLKTISLDHGRPTIHDLGYGGYPDFSPADDRLIHCKARFPAVETFGVELINLKGTDRQPIGGYGRPRWSPDFNTFLLASLTSPRCSVTIVDVRPEASGQVAIERTMIHSPPSWAGQGTIVAVLDTGVEKQIALVDVATPARAEVKTVLWTTGKSLDLVPSFPIYSPVTGRCVFVGVEPGKGNGAALYGFEHGQTTKPQRLETAGLDRTIQDLAFSPDGRYVLFASDRGLGGRSAHARSRSADAPALAGITIDGDLTDWPAAMPRHAIDNIHQFPNTNGPGPREHGFLSTSADLSACFSVGYDPREQVIYVAIVVRDDALVVGNTSPWDTDSVEIYLDGLHGETVANIPNVANWDQTLEAGDTPALQYIGIPGKGRVYGVTKSVGQERGEENPLLTMGDIKKTKTKMAFRRVGDVTTYEWAVQPFDHYPDQPTRLGPGVQIGFDIVICDKDKPAQSARAVNDPENDRSAYVSWGPSWRRLKHLDAANLGELILGRVPHP